MLIKGNLINHNVVIKKISTQKDCKNKLFVTNI